MTMSSISSMTSIAVTISSCMATTSTCNFHTIIFVFLTKLTCFYPYYLHKMVILYNCFTQRKKIILPLHHVGGVNEQTKHAVFELACSTLPSFLHPAWTIHWVKAFEGSELDVVWFLDVAFELQLNFQLRSS